jgi:hypothetical protein
MRLCNWTGISVTVRLDLRGACRQHEILTLRFGTFPANLAESIGLDVSDIQIRS